MSDMEPFREMPYFELTQQINKALKKLSKKSDMTREQRDHAKAALLEVTRRWQNMID